jgi:hypothetical protein
MPISFQGEKYGDRDILTNDKKYCKNRIIILSTDK